MSVILPFSPAILPTGFAAPVARSIVCSAPLASSPPTIELKKLRETKIQGFAESAVF